MNEAGFCLEPTQGSSVVRSYTVHPAVKKGWNTSGMGLSIARPAAEGSVSHRDPAIPAKVPRCFFHLPNWRTACSAQGCWLNSALSHRQVCREKKGKLISKTGKHLEKKVCIWKKVNTSLSGVMQVKSMDFYRECFCKTLQNLQGNYDIKQRLQLQNGVWSKKCYVLFICNGQLPPFPTRVLAF